MDAASAPPRPRPRNRRAEIARNAGELFSVRGFHGVRMDDIAEASGITARALYRHYANKQALLSHVVLEDQQHVVDTITELAGQPSGQRDLDATLIALTEAALDSRRLSLLWQREARHLDAEDFQLVRRRTQWIATQLEELLLTGMRRSLGGAVTEIRSWVIVSVISGAGFYDSPLPRPRLAQELVAASRRVIDAAAAIGPDEPVQAADRAPLARREQLVSAAAQEFRAKGFAGVGIDDIGGRVGVVGPALYRYFDTKADILIAAVNRLHEWLALETARALRTPGPDDAVLGLLVEGYVRVALEATDLLAVWRTERLHLPDAARERIDRIQADHLAEWQHWLGVARPDLPDADAATLVTTARTIIDDCARIPHFRRYPAVAAELSGAALAALGLGPAAPAGAES
ncbi:MULTISPECIES: TetR/AcrR family transcriptional regulator [Pseudonocardia]|uniref:HTH-type transcriptional repressor KstR2 n=2 Tax=Pseudonocardia TaxID=1847 RepID=A0A1Y2MSN5_PSEAH|nr:MULTISPECIES: TetR/AcrR family transcriptional regulator [Pseudonocardia]OSY38232.1 HTH-type transcriptional repressor KstR2 [Pseudonocardia autotrophica]TDN71042.1 TetR family transcriptional regulator [Pseudonocardia autotrophica]BBG01711.1 transcriptional repressor Mce3R [Pseudonocardia autotrophica]GEC27414.1 transcriptional repressor Mce3R [Pseudonocardia saturnea]